MLQRTIIKVLLSYQHWKFFILHSESRRSWRLYIYYDHPKVIKRSYTSTYWSPSNFTNSMIIYICTYISWAMTILKLLRGPTYWPPTPPTPPSLWINVQDCIYKSIFLEYGNEKIAECPYWKNMDTHYFWGSNKVENSRWVGGVGRLTSVGYMQRGCRLMLNMK